MRAGNRFYLEIDPFPIDSVDGYFVSTPALRGRLDQVHRAAHDGTRPVCIAAPAGSGKTTLLEQALGDFGPQWQVARISGASGLDRASFLGGIGDAFDLSIGEDDSVDAVFDRLEARLERPPGLDRTALIAIDDAGGRSAGTLADLDALLVRRQSSRLRFIAVREPAPEDPSGQAAPLLMIDIPPLTRAECDDYVHTRLCAAGLRGDSPFTEKMLSSIHNASDGRPGRIHRIAARVLANLRGTRRLDGGAGRSRRRGIRARIAAAVAPESPERPESA